MQSKQTFHVNVGVMLRSIDRSIERERERQRERQRETERDRERERVCKHAAAVAL